MARVDQVVPLDFQEHARDFQHGAASAAGPLVAEVFEALGRGLTLPVGGELLGRDRFDQVFGKADREQDVNQVGIWEDVGSHFEDGERGRGRGVGHRNALAVPAAARFFGALAAECGERFGVLRRDDSPRGEAHE